jgi:hypothetical protein
MFRDTTLRIIDHKRKYVCSGHYALYKKEPIEFMMHTKWIDRTKVRRTVEK